MFAELTSRVQETEPFQSMEVAYSCKKSVEGTVHSLCAENTSGDAHVVTLLTTLPFARAAVLSAASVKSARGDVPVICVTNVPFSVSLSTDRVTVSPYDEHTLYANLADESVHVPEGKRTIVAFTNASATRDCGPTSGGTSHKPKLTSQLPCPRPKHAVCTWRYEACE